MARKFGEAELIGANSGTVCVTGAAERGGGDGAVRPAAAAAAACSDTHSTARSSGSSAPTRTSRAGTTPDARSESGVRLRIARIDYVYRTGLLARIHESITTYAGNKSRTSHLQARRIGRPMKHALLRLRAEGDALMPAPSDAARAWRYQKPGRPRGLILLVGNRMMRSTPAGRSHIPRRQDRWYHHARLTKWTTIRIAPALADMTVRE